MRVIVRNVDSEINVNEKDPLFSMPMGVTSETLLLNYKGYSTLDSMEEHTKNTKPIDALNMKELRHKRSKWTLIITFSSLVLIIVFITIAYLIAKTLLTTVIPTCNVDDLCDIRIVETIPSVLNYSKSTQKEAISKHWIVLISSAMVNINILSSYWSLKNTDVPGGPYPQAKIGEEIYDELVAASKRGVYIRIIQQMPTSSFQQIDTQELAKLKNVEVRSLNMKRLLNAGIIHTKSIIVDNMHFYVGSANFDWRSLSEVKELGTVMYNCSCSGLDIVKIFNINWDMAKEDSSIPEHWPIKYQTPYSKDFPMTLKPSNVRTYISTSPPQFCSKNRTSDITAILDVIRKANRFIYIAVMDYFAAIVYTKPKKYWNVIDDALREAMYNRQISIRLLASKWEHLSQEQVVFLKSLNEFGKMASNGSLEVKLFTMPPSSIPFSRVNHNKYMVTDNAAFISTSNWSGDYFISTGGISVVYNQTGQTDVPDKDTYQGQLVEIFQRDWNSKFAQPV